MPAQRKIALLSETTINQIAAGEVIENGASVVKELLENALDAGSSEITIETQAGGRGLMRIVDDGCGMSEEDLHLALQRHATSKIRSVEDLHALGTLGFRGEALPSIASISKLTIHTATAEGGGVLMAISGGKGGKCQGAPRRRGTTIEVASLFYNVPARKKFQKSVAADTSEIHKVALKAALGTRAVAFTWRHDGKEHFHIGREEPLLGRIETLLGSSFADDLLPMRWSHGEISLEGFLGKPSACRVNRSGQFFFINGRPINSPSLSAALLQGYGTRLPAHRYPLCVLHLCLPGSSVDVNVHPQKKEVRFSDEKGLLSSLSEVVSATLQKAAPAPSVSFPKECFKVAERIATYTPSAPLEEEVTWIKPRAFRFVHSLGRHFLVQKEEEQLLLVDQIAARRRLFHEDVARGLNVQTLLFPLTFEFSPLESQIIESKLDELRARGFSIRNFGKQTFLVDALPATFEPDQVKTLLESLLSQKGEDRVMSACLHTLRSKKLTPAEAEGLAEKLFATEQPHECPFGKPTFVVLDEKHLGKLFS